MKKALYRLYRPCRLEDVVGEEQVTAPLAEMLKTGNFAHAFLFAGPRGCGKTSVARIFAHAINGFDYQLEDDYIDIIEIDAASNTGVDNIRDLREKATIVPSEGKYKVYIIDEIHMLSKSAFNALLKTLEEPPAHVVFIMATTDPDKIPATILSRTQVYQFKLVDPATMLSHLEKICDKEGIKIATSALEVIVRRGGGSFRDSLSLLEQVSSLAAGDSPITVEQVTTALGLPSDEIVSGLLQAYRSGDLAAASDLLKSFYNIGGQPESLASNLISRILDNPDPAFFTLLSKLPEVKEPFADARLLLCFMPATSTPMPTTASVPLPATMPAPVPAASISPTQASLAPSPVSTPAPSEEPQPTPSPSPAPEASSPTTFDYSAFLERVNAASSRIATLLKSATYSISGNTVTITPSNGLAKKSLSRPDAAKVFHDAADGFVIIISGSAPAAPQNLKKDPTIAQISDIMGNVQEVDNGGGIPF